MTTTPNAAYSLRVLYMENRKRSKKNVYINLWLSKPKTALTIGKQEPELLQIEFSSKAAANKI